MGGTVVNVTGNLDENGTLFPINSI
jgi:hypothetical protein